MNTKIEETLKMIVLNVKFVILDQKIYYVKIVKKTKGGLMIELQMIYGIDPRIIIFLGFLLATIPISMFFNYRKKQRNKRIKKT